MICAICGCNDRENCKYAIATDNYVSAFKRALCGEKIIWSKTLILSSAIMKELEEKQKALASSSHHLVILKHRCSSLKESEE